MHASYLLFARIGSEGRGWGVGALTVIAVDVVDVGHTVAEQHTLHHHQHGDADHRDALDDIGRDGRLQAAL